MNATEYILSKQIQWAHNSNIKLIGSRKTRGRPAYTRNLKENLFEPLNPKVKKQIDKGDGGELKGKSGNPAKIQAVHSSSALAKRQQGQVFTGCCPNQASKPMYFRQKCQTMIL